MYGTSSYVNVNPDTNATSGFLGISRNHSRISPHHPMTTQKHQLLPETLTAPQYYSNHLPQEKPHWAVYVKHNEGRANNRHKEFHDPGKQHNLFLALSSTK